MKKPYLTRLERWARWTLPRPEAEDVIADYREIVGNPPRSDEELLRDLGKPRNVIRPLAQKKQYCTWLAAFAVMAACLLIPAVSPLPGGLYPVWFTLFNPGGFLIPGVPLFLYFLVGGIALSLIWFRPRQGASKPPLPRTIPIALAALLAVMGLVWWTFWQITLYPDGALTNPILHLPYGFWWPLGDIWVGGNVLQLVLEFGAIPLAAVGITALVKARTRDRRWRAVYVLSLSALLLAFAVLALLSSMDPSTPSADPFAYTRRLCLVITLLGAVGTGVSLC